MEQRLRYARLIPDGIAKMTALEHYLNTETSLELVAYRMNGFEYCITLCTAKLKKHNKHKSASTQSQTGATPMCTPTASAQR